ncbi:unnamed protein product [Leptosia nina]|uniref:CCHC-type domain-containing protein n=1 Tax=Leptosia nina TaxID=320188 RepID=A0AAV1JXU6_9NEOP
MIMEPKNKQTDVKGKGVERCEREKTKKEERKELRVSLVRTPTPRPSSVVEDANRQMTDLALSDSDDGSMVSVPSCSSGRLFESVSTEFLDRDKSRFWETRKRSRLSEDDDSSTDTPSKAGKKRGRGRPPTTGEYIGLAEAKRAYLKAQREEMEAQAEAELLASAIEAKKTRSMSLEVPDMPGRELPIDIQERIEASIGLVEQVAQKSSNLKGTFVKVLKKAVAELKEDTAVLAQRTLSEETQALREDNARLRRQIGAMQKEMAELKALVQKGQSGQTSANNLEELESRMMQRVTDRINARIEGLEDRLNPEPSYRPALKGRLRDKLNKEADTEKRISRQEGFLKGKDTPAATAGETRKEDKRKEEKKKKKKSKSKGKGEDREVEEAPSVVASTSAPVLPSTSRAQTQDPASVPVQETWATVTRKGRKSAPKTSQAQAARTPQPPQTRETRESAQKKTAPKPRLKVPRSSAVVISVSKEAEGRGLTYPEVLREAKTKIDLADVGIESVKFRRAVTGAAILEIPGASSHPKAELLATKLKAIYVDEGIKVYTPVKLTDVRVTALDLAVTSEELRAALAKKGECPGDQIRVGAVVPDRTGRNAAWAQVPTTAAKKLVVGRFLVGWMEGVIKIAKPREMRCFRCLRTGHVAAKCPDEDRSQLCYRCSEAGHLAKTCTANSHCALCAKSGKKADHRLGGKKCSAPSKKGGKTKPATTAAGGTQPTGSTMETEEIVAD